MNQRFVYDAENRQTQFFNGANSTQTPNATYQYDGEGKRVRKFSGGVETIFVYNGGGTLIAEYSTQLSTTPQVSYLTSDALGSPRILTDGGGAVISRHDHRAFGDEISANVGGRTTAQKYGATDDVRKQYTGYERDTESGLDYAQARYYSSAHGRFTSVDPLTASATIRNPQTFNRYSYVVNSPYKFVDPLGLALSDIGVYQTDNPEWASRAERKSMQELKQSIQDYYTRQHRNTSPPPKAAATGQPESSSAAAGSDEDNKAIAGIQEEVDELFGKGSHTQAGIEVTEPDAKLIETTKNAIKETYYAGKELDKEINSLREKIPSGSFEGDVDTETPTFLGLQVWSQDRIDGKAIRISIRQKETDFDQQLQKKGLEIIQNNQSLSYGKFNKRKVSFTYDKVDTGYVIYKFLKTAGNVGRNSNR